MKEMSDTKYNHRNSIALDDDTLSETVLIPSDKMMMTSCSEKCKARFSVMIALAIIGCIFLSVLTISFHPNPKTTYVLLVQKQAPVEHVTSNKFLSVALDSSMIAEGFSKFDMRNVRLRNMIRNLSPGYLRIGGTMADRLIFVTNDTQSVKVHNSEQDTSDCAYENKQCLSEARANFTMTGTEWGELYDLAFSTGFTIVFDLNCLLRKSDGSWDSENGEKLIRYSNDHNMNVVWQLGNEPNSFRVVFNSTVNATQLAKDFGTLKKILNKYAMYTNAFIIGPDVTRPRPDDMHSYAYLREFLAAGGGNTVNAVTFHQYYFNGRTVPNTDFLNPQIYNLLVAQIDLVKSLVSNYETDKKAIWLSETSDAYGGGAPGFSNRYIGTFIWLDKLGIAAKLGLDVVVRQTLFKGFYALIDNSYEPTPNYWISAVYKAFVGPEVLPCIKSSSEQVRLYCQCTNKKFKTSALTLFGINLKDTDAVIRVEGLRDPRHALDTILAYVLSPYLTLYTKNIYLNKELLVLGPNGELPPFKPKLITDEVHVTIPPYSSAFFVIPTDIPACQ